MSFQDYARLESRDLGELLDISRLVDDLMSHQGALPGDMAVQLGTFRADLSAAIEDKEHPSE
jgi:hypothetical protein